MTNEINFSENTKHMSYEDKMLYAYIGEADKFFWYKKVFSKYENGSIWSWSWYAFLFGFLYLIHRKCYLYGFIAFVVGTLLSPGIILYKILMGGFGTYFIYTKYENKKREIEESTKDENLRLVAMSSAGGTNMTIVLVVLLPFVLCLMFLLLLIGIAIRNSML